MTQIVLLGDLVDISSSKRIFYKEYVDTGVPFYRSKEIIEKASGKNDISTELFITEERFGEIERKFGAPGEGDLLLTSVGTLGIPYLVQKNERFYFKDGNLTWFRNFRPELDRKYLLYWLTSQDGKNELLNHTIGSTQKALTIQGLKKVRVPLPDVETQKKIADILGTIDEKIELNRRMNETLEQMGQALFRHYFNNNPEAEKWEKKSLSEQVEILSGGTPKTSEESYWGGDIPWFSVVDAPAGSNLFTIRTSKNITEAGLKNSAAKLIPKHTTIISARGTVGKLALAGKEMTINQSCYALRSDTPFYAYLMTNHCLTDIKSRVHGSVFDTITRNTFDQLSFPAPPVAMLNQLEKEIEPLFLQILNNVEETQTLITLRDTLLPRLINGKVKI